LFLMRFFSTGNPATWSVAQVASWLDTMHLGDCNAAFEQNEIDGATLPSVDDATLESLGMSSQARGGQVRQAITGLFASPQGLNECVLPDQCLHMLTMLSCRPSSAVRHVFVRRMCWAVVRIDCAKRIDCINACGCAQCKLLRVVVRNDGKWRHSGLAMHESHFSLNSLHRRPLGRDPAGPG
jgi:hypothetical protein